MIGIGFIIRTLQVVVSIGVMLIIIIALVSAVSWFIRLLASFFGWHMRTFLQWIREDYIEPMREIRARRKG